MAETAKKATEEKQKATILDINMADFLKRFNGYKADEPIPTGFEGLDEMLKGGLTNGLYVVNGDDSVRNTNFALQMACQIAKTGKRVVFFSLNTTGERLIAKCLSREMGEYCCDKHIKSNAYKTADEILRMGFDGSSEELSQTEQTVFSESVERLASYGDKINCFSILFEPFSSTFGSTSLPLGRIEFFVEKILDAGEKPVVIVDDLRTLAAYEGAVDEKYYTAKQTLNKILFKLKGIGVYVPVIAVNTTTFGKKEYKNYGSAQYGNDDESIKNISDVVINMQDETGFSNPVLKVTLMKGGEKSENKEICTNLLYNIKYNFFFEV